MKYKKNAIILFNIGGPSSIKGVRVYLFKFFMDKHIIPLPYFFRIILAVLISFFRGFKTQKIYQAIGGGSPLYKNTQKQANALEKALNHDTDISFKCFVSMRYTSPFSKDVIKDVKKWGADKIYLLPLYPQYSYTTTQSSFDDFDKHYNDKKEVIKIKDYHSHDLFIEAMVDKLKISLDKVLSQNNGDKSNIRILFSAHGLPKKVIEKGDPYQKQVEETSNLVMKKIGKEFNFVVCYQSRVGFNKWIEPYFENELIKAAQDKCSVVVVPISFVSDHSETLYELDILYKKKAEDLGVPLYIRTESLGDSDLFILCLKNLII